MSGASGGMTAGADIPGEITHRGIVNTSECDENGHMNVQFYWSKFEKADAQFRLMAGLSPDDTPRISRHLRYHSELHGAYGLHVVSRFATDAEGDIVIVHQLFESDRNVLSATALDRIAISDVRAEAIGARLPRPVPPAALPRSLKSPVPDFTMSEAAWIAAGAELTCRTMIEPHLTGVDGAITDRGLVALTVEAAPASWTMGGFPQHRLTENGLGRVAVEKRLFVYRRPRVGDPVHMLTRIIAVERVTFSVRHHYFDSRTRAFLCACDVTLLPMDLTARKGVALPDDIRQRMQSLVDG